MTETIPVEAEDSVFSTRALGTVLLDGLRKFDPRYLWHNPVLLLTEVGAALTTAIAVLETVMNLPTESGGSAMPPGFSWALAVGFWGCLYTATLAESIAEGRGRSKLASLQRQQGLGSATRVINYSPDKDRAALDAATEVVQSRDLHIDDVLIVAAGETIPADGEVLWGAAEIDESTVTGLPGPVIRESFGDRTAVTGGTRDLSDRIVMRVTALPEDGLVERALQLAAKARRKRPPLEVALSALLASFSLSFVTLALTLNSAISPVASPVSIPVLIAVVICLIPTEVAALMSVTGIAGMQQLLRRGVMVTSSKALETAGNITTILLDKTGTVTVGDRRAIAFVALREDSEQQHALHALIDAAALSSSGDDTPEGRSIVQLAREHGSSVAAAQRAGALDVTFTAMSRLSGIDLHDGTQIRKGAVSAITSWLKLQGTQPSKAVRQQLKAQANAIARTGGTPLVVAVKHPHTAGEVLGIVHLSDVVKAAVPERISKLSLLGVRTILVTGDHQVTAEAIAREVGIDEWEGDSTPEDKLALIEREQLSGHVVAMSGDGVNDAPALAQADIGIAMNTATAAAKHAANMIILDDNPAHLVDIIEVGRKQMATRGALVTFNFANDAVRYLTLFPALLVGVFPGLGALNILHLHSPASAILSTVLFSTLVMGVLVPMALVGVPYRVTEMRSALTMNILVNGLSGVLMAAGGIKLIDLVVSQFPGY